MERGRQHTEDAGLRDFIDFGQLFRDFLRYLRKYWHILLIMTVLCGAGYTAFRIGTTKPVYRSEATFTVGLVGAQNSNTSYYYSTTAAAQMSSTFPYILDSAPDSVLVFGFIDTYNHTDVLSGRVDRLDGTSFEEPLLQEWRCYPLPSGNLRKYFIGDTAARSYRWLLPAAGAAGERAFVLVEGERFSLVNWPQQLPQEGPGGPISWWEDLQVDPATETAWIWSFDPGHGGRQYLAGISYGALLRGESAEWALYYSDPVEGLPANPACLMLPEGRFLIAGGPSR